MSRINFHGPGGRATEVLLYLYGLQLCQNCLKKLAYVNIYSTALSSVSSIKWGLILLIHYWFLRVAALGPLIPLFCVLPCYMYWWSRLQSMIVFQMVSPFLEQPICQPINFWTGPPSWGSPFSSQSGLRFTQQPLAWEQASVCLSASREELCISIWAYKILFLKWTSKTWNTVNTILWIDKTLSNIVIWMCSISCYMTIFFC